MKRFALTAAPACRLALTLLSIIAGSVIAAPSLKVTQLFSNIDGTQQFIQLQETAGLDGQQHLAGLMLTIRNVQGATKEFTFPADLPNDRTAGESVLIAVGALPYWSDPAAATEEQSSFAPDFVIPARFILTEGGTIDFAGEDQWSYPPLPIDGWRSVSRDGTAGIATFRGFQREAKPRFRPGIVQSGGVAVEYYNAGLDHYFVTALAADIDAIESGRTPGWEPTGETFEVAGGRDQFYPANARPAARDPHILDQPVCRFYMPPGHGNSHFLSADPNECEAVRILYPGFIEESKAAFFAVLPDKTTGACPLSHYGYVPESTPIFVPWRPVYRLWNQRIDSNHRYTTKPAIRDAMVALGHAFEGIAFCVGPPMF